MFQLFFDEEVLQYLVDQTNLYAPRDQSDHSFSTDIDEMLLFLSILLISGYNPIVRKRMYWELNPDSFNEAISKAMPRRRFEILLKYLHLADNASLPTDDRMGKVRPFYSMINERCLIFFPTTQNLSIDESMIPYYGHHGSKQRIQSKPIRVGYKQWVMASPDGYVIQFEPYQGSKYCDPIRSTKTK